MSKSFEMGWINKSLISLLAVTTMFVGVYSSILYFNTDLSNNSKTAQAATTYTCAGIGGTLSGTNCILDRTVGYNNTAGGAVPNYSVTDPNYNTATGWSLVPGSIYNNYVDGLRVQLSDNAYNAAGALQTSPSAGFFGQSTDARSGLLEMGKYRFVSEQKCAIPGVQDEIFTRAPAYNTPLVGKFDSTGNNCAATVAGTFVSAYNVPISGQRYISLQVCAIPGNLNELFLDGQPVNSPSNCGETVAGTMVSRNVMDLLGNRYINVQNCAIPGVPNELFAWSTSPNPDGSNNCAGTVAGSAASVFSIDLFDPSRGAGNIQYQIMKAAAVATSDLTENDIPGLTVECTSAPVNSTTVCNFILPSDKTLPANFSLTIGNGSINAADSYTCPIYPDGSVGCPAPPMNQACNVNLDTVTCTNVPTGNSIGNMPIYGNIGTGASVSKTNTGELVQITGINFGAIDWVFSPDQGSTGPLFRSTDATTVTVRNFRTIFDPEPTSDTRYRCLLEYRSLNDRQTTLQPIDWTPLNRSPANYDPSTGCEFTFTKAQRANNLNYGLRLTITDALVTNPNTYTFYNEYIFRFQGAGLATGGGTTTSLSASAVQANYGQDIPAITITGATIPAQTPATISIPGCVSTINGFVNNNIFTAPSTPGTQAAGIDRSIPNCANLGASQATLNITGYSPVSVALTMLAAGRVKPVSMTYSNDLNNQALFASGTGIKIVKQGTTTPLGTTSNVNTIMQGDTVTITVTGLVDFETNQPVNSGTCSIDLATTPNGQTSQGLISANSAVPVVPTVNISNGSCTISGKVMQQGEYKVRLITKGPKGQLINMGDPFNTLMLLI